MYKSFASERKSRSKNSKVKTVFGKGDYTIRIRTNGRDKLLILSTNNTSSDREVDPGINVDGEKLVSGTDVETRGTGLRT